uniref:Uncharacterized protein n=1 Tax=Parascaris equorum TaxID=6256 RepID=A0A914R346_PAREQ
MLVLINDPPAPSLNFPPGPPIAILMTVLSPFSPISPVPFVFNCFSASPSISRAPIVSSLTTPPLTTSPMRSTPTPNVALPPDSTPWVSLSLSSDVLLMVLFEAFPSLAFPPVTSLSISPVYLLSAEISAAFSAFSTSFASFSPAVCICWDPRLSSSSRGNFSGISVVALCVRIYSEGDVDGAIEV